MYLHPCGCGVEAQLWCPHQCQLRRQTASPPRLTWGGQKCSYSSLMHPPPLLSSLPLSSLPCPSFPLSPWHHIHIIPFPLLLFPLFLHVSSATATPRCFPLRTVSASQPSMEMQKPFNSDLTFPFLCTCFLASYQCISITVCMHLLHICTKMLHKLHKITRRDCLSCILQPQIPVAPTLLHLR